jgi:predicted nucleotidyltransferase
MNLNNERINTLEISSIYKQILTLVCHSLLEISKENQSIVLIGSASRSGDFNTGKSDIDLCVYNDRLFEKLEQLPALSEYFSKIGFEVLMPANFVQDYAGKRVEMFVSRDGLMIDLTWITTELPASGTAFFDIPQDYLEIHIANLFIHGKLLYGSQPNSEFAQKYYLPYLSEDIRKPRMKVIKSLLQSKLSSLDAKIANQDPEIFNALPRVQALFLQWFFLSQKIYPTSYSKYLTPQLKKTNMPENLFDSILCSKGENIYEIGLNLANAIKQILRTYNLPE